MGKDYWRRTTPMKRFVRYLSLVLLAALLLSLMPPAMASQPGSGTMFAMVTGTSSLNLRNGPGTGYQWLGSVKRGGWVEVIENFGDWFLVRVINQNLSGYMSSKFLTTAGTAGGGSTVIVNNPVPTQFLNLRQFPSLTAPVLGIYYNGASGTVLGESGGWYHVQMGSQVGYFRGEYLRFSGTGGSYSSSPGTIYSANGGVVNLRLGPGYAYNVLGQYNPGTAVSVHLKGNGFWYVTAGGRSGFIDQKFLRTGSSGPVNPPSVPGGASNGVVTNTGKWLNLREQPSINARVLGQYPGGTELIIESQGAEWCRVTVRSSGAKGYMMSRFITLYGMPGANTKRVVHPQGSYVNLRTQPSKAAGSVIVRVPHGNTVSVVSPDGAWTHVRYGNYVGYMMSAFLR